MSDLRTAAQQAQEKQKPLSVEDLARALVASRVIDAAAIDDPEGYDDGVTLERVRGLHRRLAALAQQEPRNQCGETCERAKLCAVCARGLAQEQEPVAWMVYTQDGKSVCVTDNPADFTDEHRALPLYTHPPRREQEQEPVAWIQPDHLQKARQAPFLCRVEPTQRCADFVPIYTHPPRREWVSLTDEEISDIFEAEPRYHYPPIAATDREFARAVEAALKDRNR
jgi:hypothetical protein